MSDYGYSFYLYRESGYFDISVDYSIDGYHDPETFEYFGDTAWNYSINGVGAGGGYGAESGNAFLSMGLGSGDEVEHHIFEFSAHNTFSAESISFRFDMLLAGAATADLVITGTDYSELIVSGSGADSLSGAGGRDHLDSGDGDDTIDGGGGNDLIDGGRGADLMAGGAGDDQYHIDRGADRTVELADGGGDHVHSRLSWTLSEHVEALTLSGPTARRGIGNASENLIYGNDAANVLGGLEGDDNLTGHGGDDLLVGGGGADRLFGGLGRDTLKGGAGDDTYLVDQRSDILVEGRNRGTDTVEIFFSISSYVLGDNLENVTFTGNAEPFRGFGNALDNIIAGARGNDRLFGMEGNDRLEGRVGDDILIGGGGTDSFVFATGEGRDRITDFDALGLEVVAIAGGSDFDTFEEIMAEARSVGPDGGSTLLKFGAGSSLLLINVALDDLTAANFGL